MVITRIAAQITIEYNFDDDSLLDADLIFMRCRSNGKVIKIVAAKRRTMVPKSIRCRSVMQSEGGAHFRLLGSGGSHKLAAFSSRSIISSTSSG